MNTMITAIYENGVLRPLRPLLLPEHTQVRVQVESVSPPTATEHRQRVREALVAAGLSLPTPPVPESSLLTEERRAELAQRFANGGPLADLILAEREER